MKFLLFRAVIFPLLTVATFLLELVQDFTVPPTTFIVLLTPDFKLTFVDEMRGIVDTVTLQVAFTLLLLLDVAVITQLPTPTATTKSKF